MNSVNVLSTIVALGILSLITTIAVVAMCRYNVDGALKVLGLLSGLFGVVTGTFVTYFFTREAAVIAQQRAAVAEVRAETAEKRYASLQSTAINLLATINAFPDQGSVAKLRKNPGFGKYFGYMGEQLITVGIKKKSPRKKKSRRKRKSPPAQPK